MKKGMSKRISGCSIIDPILFSDLFSCFFKIGNISSNTHYNILVEKHKKFKKGEC